MGNEFDIFKLVRLMAFEIVNAVDPKQLYTNVNKRYPTAPSNYHLEDVNTIAEYIKDQLIETSTTEVLHIIEDPQVGEEIFGLYIHRGSNCYIKINANLNHCWKRFVILKELCSLYVDHSARTTFMLKYDNYLISLKNAFDQKSRMLVETDRSESLRDSETFSILLATELMIPIHQREVTKNLIKQIGNGMITLNDIAKSLLIPEYVLKLYVDMKLIDSDPQYIVSTVHQGI